MNNLSVILCSYNEVSNIQVTLNKLLSRSEIDEIIIIDDNSNDGTLKIIKSFNNPKIKLFVRENTRGFASAFILGIKESSGKIILRFDIDMHDAIDTFLSGLKQIDFNDCIIFSRYINGGKDLRNNFRKVSSKIINILCQAILSKKILDYTSCLILFKSISLHFLLKFIIPHLWFNIESLY